MLLIGARVIKAVQKTASTIRILFCLTFTRISLQVYWISLAELDLYKQIQEAILRFTYINERFLKCF